MKRVDAGPIAADEGRNALAAGQAALELAAALAQDQDHDRAVTAFLDACLRLLDVDAVELWRGEGAASLTRQAGLVRQAGDAEWFAARALRLPPDDFVRRLPASARGLGAPTDGSPLAQAGIVSTLSLPLRVDGRLLGVLAMMSRTPLDAGTASPSLAVLAAAALAQYLARGAAATTASGVAEVELLARIERTERDNQRLQALTRELVEVEERTRARMARVIHDELQQILVAISFSLGTIHDEESASKRRTRQLVSTAIQRSRELSTELSPPILQDGSLEDALRWLARESQRLHGIQVHVQVDLPGRIRSDDIRRTVFRLVQEALLNISKHAGTRQAWVELCRDGRGDVVVSIVDQGQGFDPDGGPGGFGTRTLRQRIENFGGRFTLTSRPGKGTRVEATLPCGVLEPEPQPGAPARPAQPAGPLRVLVVDDHALIRTGLCELLEDADGFEVAAVASSGEQALALLGSQPVDAVLLDVNLPDIGGIEIARRARALWPALRIVGLSMHDDPAIADAMRRAGADAFLSKSAQLDRILEALGGGGG